MKLRGPARARACRFSPACHHCRWPGRVAASTTSLACSRRRRPPGSAVCRPCDAGCRRPGGPRRCSGPTPGLGSGGARARRSWCEGARGNLRGGDPLRCCLAPWVHRGRICARARACKTDRRGRHPLTRRVASPRVVSRRVRVVVLRKLL